MARGLCDSHYRQLKAGHPLTPLNEYKRDGDPERRSAAVSIRLTKAQRRTLDMAARPLGFPSTYALVRGILEKWEPFPDTDDVGESVAL